MKRTESHAPAVEDYLDYRAYLSDWFTWKKQVSAQFSQRGFSRRVGQKSPSLGVDLIAGRRSMTVAMVVPFAKALDLSSEERTYLKWLVQLDRAKTVDERNAAWEQLAGHRRFREAHKVSGDGFRYVSDWTCPAVRELALRPDFQADATWISRTLVPAITEARAQQALDTLFSLKLLVRADDGRVQQADAAVVTPSEVQGLAAHNYHRGMMELARDGIERFQPKERHYTGVTVCIPTAIVPEIKRELQAFAERLLELCDGADGTPERVYQLHLAAFPLSRVPEDES